MTPKPDHKGLWTEFKTLQKQIERKKQAGGQPTAAQTKRFEELRNRLLLAYTHLVDYNAERVYQRLPREIELDDLRSSGLFGLMEAIIAFDPARGVKFETYCSARIRGAIIDELRSLDWVPRLVRSRTAKMEGAVRKLEAELGRPPTATEIAARLKLPPGEYEKLVRDAHARSVVSLSRKCYETDSHKDVREIDMLQDKRCADPLRDVLRKDLRQVVTRGLSRAEQLIVLLYYFEELTMKEIGSTLLLSESRVSQMHTSIMARLRAQMSERRRELAEVAAS
jgi:RNA polymerase sigma factor for flagellar operon FliA